jgi:hypothetical protein
LTGDALIDHQSDLDPLIFSPASDRLVFRQWFQLSVSQALWAALEFPS